jgi:hypothetical protein
MERAGGLAGRIDVGDVIEAGGIEGEGRMDDTDTLSGACTCRWQPMADEVGNR